MVSGSRNISLNVPAARFALSTEVSTQDKVARELGYAGLLAHGEQREPRGVAFTDLAKLPYLEAVRAPSPRATDFWVAQLSWKPDVAGQSVSIVDIAHIVIGHTTKDKQQRQPLQYWPAKRRKPLALQQRYLTWAGYTPARYSIQNQCQRQFNGL